MQGCSSLVALPESIGGLDALTELNLYNCARLVFPPIDTHGDTARVKHLLANTTRLLNGEISAADADEDVKSAFIEGVITNASFADRLEEAVRKDPALADLTNAKGERAIDLACLECRRAMQKALYFLGRYEIADGPPEHRSATSLVVRAVDHVAKRAAQRRAEEDFRRREIEQALDTKPGAALEADASRDAAPKAAAAPKTTDGAGAAATPANSQEIAASLKNIESKLDQISDRPGPCCTVA